MHDDDETFFEGPSKSEVKRQMHALQALGERLVALPDAQLAKIPIDDEALADAIQLARRIKARSGLKRQLQYIGKLMRSVDADPIAEALDLLDGQHQTNAARFHQLEQLRDRLLHDGDEALSEVASRYPEVDRSHLRQLLRNYQKEQKTGKDKGTARAVFRYLRSLDEQAAGDADSVTD
ncbi:MAG: ribosome biogenesis factor YjgA [Halieaceae bacterium]|jgi:ribosome-associated protein|nr:ribosome biogenesis factor YjgA [Halieaceae bacterium]